MFNVHLPDTIRRTNQHLDQGEVVINIWILKR